MSDFTDFVSDSFTESLDEFGDTITIRGEPYTANVGQLVENPEFIPGSQAPKKICVVTLAIPAADFDPPLAKNERIATPHGALQIVTIARDSTYTLTLGDIFAKR